MCLCPWGSNKALPHPSRTASFGEDEGRPAHAQMQNPADARLHSSATVKNGDGTCTSGEKNLMFDQTYTDRPFPTCKASIVMTTRYLPSSTNASGRRPSDARTHRTIEPQVGESSARVARTQILVYIYIYMSIHTLLGNQ